MKFYAFPQRIIVSYAYFPSGFGIGGAVGHVVFFNQRDIQLFNIGAVKKLITAFAAKGLSQRGVFVFLKFGLIAEAGKRPDVGFMPAEAFFGIVGCQQNLIGVLAGRIPADRRTNLGFAVFHKNAVVPLIIGLLIFQHKIKHPFDDRFAVGTELRVWRILIIAGVFYRS